MLAETGPEINPFCSVSGAGTSVSNEFGFSNGDCGGVGFVFGAKPSGLDENLDNGAEVSSDKRAEVNSGNGREFNKLESVSAKQDDPGPRRDFCENEGKSGYEGIDSTKVGNEDEGRKYSGIGFVFGSGWFSSSSNLNDSSGNMEKLPTEVGGKIKVESETEFGKLKANSFEFQNEKRWCSNEDHDEGIFAFGSSSKKGSSLTDSKLANCQDEVKSSDEDLGDCKTNSNSQNDNLSSDFSSKCKLVFESCNSVLTEETFRDNHESTDHVVFGSESNTAGTTIGIASSRQFTFQAGPGDSVDAGQFPQCQINKPNAGAGPCSFSSIGLGFQQNSGVSEAASAGEVKSTDESRFTSTPDGFGVCFEDFNTPLRFPSCLRENLFPEINKSKFSAKGTSVRDKRSRKTRGKSKKPSLSKQWPAQDHVPKESSSQETPVSSGCYSPMDFSPYEETTFADPHSRETSATSDNSFHLVSNTAPCASDATVPIGPNGDDFSAAEGKFPNKGDQIYEEPIDENSRYHSERIFAYNCSSKGSDSGAETPCFSSKNEHFNGISCVGKDSEDVRADIGVNVESQERDCGTPCFASGFENMEGKTFTFMGSSFAEGTPIVAKHRLRRVKNKMKGGRKTFVITPSQNVEFGGSDQFTPHSSTPLIFDAAAKSEPQEQVTEVHIPSTDATHETCEKLRIRLLYLLTSFYFFIEFCL